MGQLAAPFSAYIDLKPNSKIPAKEGWQKTKPGQPRTKRDCGVCIQPGELVIDVDAYKPDGAVSHKKLLARCPELKNTFTIKTPRGGYHYYVFIPADAGIKWHQSEYPGVDFQHPGKQVPAEGTVTADGTYTRHTNQPFINLPKGFLDTLETPDEKKTAATTGTTLICEPQFISDCQTWPPAIQDQQGDDTTYRLACRAMDYGLPMESAFQILLRYYNPRCSPPWTDTDLRKKTVHAYEYAKNTAGVSTPQAVFTPEPQTTNVVSIDAFQHDKVMDVIHRKQLATTVDKNGKIVLVKSLGNVGYFLREDSSWKGRILYNQFADRLEIKGRPDWRRSQLNADDGLTDMDFSNLRLWFSSNEAIRFEVSKGDLKDACYGAATHYHPVVDYLNGLVWDGEPRLDALLPDTTGCADTPYTRAVGAKTIISAVKRIFEPGCKHDYVPVFESNQGTKKSQWISTLGGAWASTGELVQGAKDTMANLKGKWIIELPEIQSSFRAADFNWLKKIITTATDYYRKVYAHDPCDVPRESIFIATLNPNASGTYLKDSENRRYWPVKTGTFNIDLLARNRDQYFAEAVHRYRAGEKNWIDDSALEDEIKAEQEQRREVDPFRDFIEPWATARPLGFTIVEVYTLCFSYLPNTRSNSDRISAVLKELGYEYKRGIGTSGRWTKRIKSWEEMV